MSKDTAVYLRDMLRAAQKVLRYTRDLTFETFLENEMAADAAIRNLEILGEATKKVPDSIRHTMPEVEWRRIAGLRDILIHSYANVSMEIIRGVIQKKLVS